MHRLVQALPALVAVALASGAGAQVPGAPAAGGEAGRPAEARVYDDAARNAWAFIDRNYVPATGLVRTSDGYAHVTIWDVASGLIALYAANELNLLPDAEYDRRMRRALQTLKVLPLYRNAVYNRAYSAQTAAMIGRGDVPSERGTGWSALDLGRFLSVLKVIASNHPQYAGEIESVVRRIDMSRVVRGGYLWGEDLPRSGRAQSYQEGKIGYEQYAAQGFAVWGFRAERALNVTENARPVTVLGVRLLADKRGGDRLTSDPFVLAAMELDLWGEEFNELARGVLAAQEARYRQTGVLTVVNEDALPVPPHYFYYYSVYQNGRSFVVDAQGPMRNVRVRPWVSTKGAFGWDAVFPSDYTRAAVDLVSQAHARRTSWGSGVYEGTQEVAGSGDVNTAAIILQAALYKRLGRRLLAPDQPAAAPAP
jgi:hypothetical protein